MKSTYKKNRAIYIGIFLLLLIMCTFFLFKNNKLVFAEKMTEPKEAVAIQTPTIMVPGTNGTVNRFDSLIKELDVDKKTSVLKITVNTDGTIVQKGKITENSSQPIIVIGFEDSSEDTLDQQGEWYQEALSFIQQYYTFDTYNYFGHSNGGLVITSYLENNQQATDPQIAKLITVGTPFNGVSEKDNELNTVTTTTLKNTSQVLEGYSENTENIPEKIKMINIAGEVEESASDNTVPVQSVLAGKLIYQEKVTLYEEYIIRGNETDHSALVENEEVIKLMKNFFW